MNLSSMNVYNLPESIQIVAENCVARNSTSLNDEDFEESSPVYFDPSGF